MTAGLRARIERSFSEDPELREIQRRSIIVIVAGVTVLATGFVLTLIGVPGKSLWFSLSVIGGVIAVGLLENLGGRETRRRLQLQRSPAVESREQRILRLTSMLHEASATLAELEQDIAEGQRLATEVAERVREQQALAEVTSAQQAAVAELVREELRNELEERDRPGLIRDIVVQVLIAVIFLAIGLWLGSM